MTSPRHITTQDAAFYFSPDRTSVPDRSYLWRRDDPDTIHADDEVDAVKTYKCSGPVARMLEEQFANRDEAKVFSQEAVFHISADRLVPVPLESFSDPNQLLNAVRRCVQVGMSCYAQMVSELPFTRAVSLGHVDSVQPCSPQLNFETDNANALQDMTSSQLCSRGLIAVNLEFVSGSQRQPNSVMLQVSVLTNECIAASRLESRLNNLWNTRYNFNVYYCCILDLAAVLA